MFLGLLLSAFGRFLVENNHGASAQSVYSLRIAVAAVTSAKWSSASACRRHRRLNASMALALFFVYAALNGLTFGVIILAYSANSGAAATVSRPS